VSRIVQHVALHCNRHSVQHMLESFTLTSSTTVPKNRQVVPGPVGFGAQGVEIGFECSLLDPSATGGRVVLRVAARTL